MLKVNYYSNPDLEFIHISDKILFDNLFTRPYKDPKNSCEFTLSDFFKIEFDRSIVVNNTYLKLEQGTQDMVFRALFSFLKKYLKKAKGLMITIPNHVSKERRTEYDPLILDIITPTFLEPNQYDLIELSIEKKLHDRIHEYNLGQKSDLDKERGIIFFSASSFFGLMLKN